MKTKFPGVAFIGCVLLLNQVGFAADPQADFNDLTERINTKLRNGQHSEAALAPELKQFDSLIDDRVAMILLQQSEFYDRLDFRKKADAILEQIVRGYPDARVVPEIKQEIAGRKINEALAVNTKFPGFAATNTEGQPLSIPSNQGKVVLIDFWATWCPPCRAEVPNVVKTYKKYHDAGFDVIGVSLDEDKSKLEAFTKEHDMTWPQYFDGLHWQNKLAVKYGIMGIPATFLVAADGTIIGRDLRGDELDQAVAQAVGKR